MPASDVTMTTFGSGDSRQVGDGRLRQPPRSEDVHVERLAEDLVGERVEIVVRDQRRPPRVVHEDVESAEALERAVDQLLALGLVADVGLHVQGLRRQCLGHGRAGLDGRRRVDHHVGTERRQPVGGDLTDATR